MDLRRFDDAKMHSICCVLSTDCHRFSNKLESIAQGTGTTEFHGSSEIHFFVRAILDGEFFE
ncbi:hypothetical protein VN12_05320 [Pirellula sp. SH-Sr6A]|uniref:hypothetical protein n=1 Tax=Pirellula sp. SH-Sr6A TaxID=1632865 RepID=UPI00078C84D9|nr:hypothetical protein [Pirellula sp. SH-Sr6A]AMV31517.1 hypothetical protein VN12_05320 [Pirellula sp. SH-Sr6A]